MSSTSVNFVTHLRTVPILRTSFAGIKFPHTNSICTTSTSQPTSSSQPTRATLAQDNTKVEDFNATSTNLQSAVKDVITDTYSLDTTINTTKPFDPAKAETPPTRYDREALRAYWGARSFELNQRYLAFAGRAAPFFASVLRHLATGTLRENEVIGQLAAQAREGMEALGPTYIKVGQMMGIRPDVIPQAAMDELQKLQDNVVPFNDAVAREVIESELGRPLDEVFSEFSETPIAAASLAQVYRARLRHEGVEVAVKVQRPEALTLCSKDMYVLQRAVAVYQRLMKRWTAQEVDYDALLDSFASGFYEELDFKNEAENQKRARKAILDTTAGAVYVPKVFDEYTSRRLLVSEFVYGKKLTTCEPAELRRLTAVAQECFLRMLLDPEQHLHCDAHGGNQLAWDAEATFAAQLPGFDRDAPPIKSWQRGEDGTLLELGLRPELCLIDFGLVRKIPEEDKPKIVLAVVHMAGKDWNAVTDDMISLGFLKPDIDRARVNSLLARILTPYVLEGGGASAFTKNGYFEPSFRNLMRDVSAATREIPFSIPSYWPVIGRGIAILEGLALAGDPSYKIVLSAYPYVARKLLQKEGAEDENFRAALNAILYPVDSKGVKQPRPSARRILSLINNALGRAAASQQTGGMFNLDALPQDTASLTETLAFLGSDKAGAIRRVLVEELVVASDLLLRSFGRRFATSVQNLTSVRLLAPTLPFLPTPRLPILNPVRFIPAAVRNAAVDRVAPPLTPEEDIYVADIVDLAQTFLGIDLQAVFSGAASPVQLMGKLKEGLASGNDSSNEGRVTQELLALLTTSASSSNGNDYEMNRARESLQDITAEVVQRLTKINRERVGI